MEGEKHRQLVLLETSVKRSQESERLINKKVGDWYSYAYVCQAKVRLKWDISGHEERRKMRANIAEGEK